MRKTSALIAAWILCGATAWGDGEAGEADAADVPLELQVVFTRYKGERKVGSEPYTLAVNANGYRSKVRMGINVPMRFDRIDDKEVPGNVVYKSVGNSIDCWANALDDGRFRVGCSFEQSSLYSSGADAGGPGTGGGSAPMGPPVLRTFNAEASMLLRDGQTAQHTAGTDPVNGEVLKVEVTLNVVK